MLAFLIVIALFNRVTSEVSPDDLQFLNEMSLEKLLRLKSSLQELVTPKYSNSSVPSEMPYLQRFGAQALAVKAPIKRTDHEDGLQKKGNYSKISSIFSMSVTTLAFLAFGGYLLCLIVQAVKSKQGYEPTVPQPTFFVSSGIKKRPQPQFASYGRRRRDNRRSARSHQAELDLPPEQLFSALLQLCEGYVKWSRHVKT